MTLRDRPGGVDGEVNHRRWDLGWSSHGVSARPGMYPMTTTTAPASTAIAVTEPVFSRLCGRLRRRRRLGRRSPGGPRPASTSPGRAGQHRPRS